jgi:DNA-binding MarR family transcriptional regulator
MARGKEAVRMGTSADDSTAAQPDGPRTPPGAADEVDVALLRLCQLMTAVTLRAGTEQRPPLSLPQIRALTMLAGVRDGLSLGRLAFALGEKPAAVTSLGSQLVRSGVIERRVGPGTEIRLLLLPAGTRLLAAVNRDRLHRLRRLLDALPVPDRTVVLDALTRLGGDATGPEESW